MLGARTFRVVARREKGGNPCLRNKVVAAIGVASMATAHAWDRDDRFGNVPFLDARPMQVQKQSILFAPANQVEIRLKGRGWFNTITTDELDKRATALLERLRSPIGEYGGVRDERYFLISLEPDIMVAAPFMFELKFKTAEQMRGLAGDVTSEITNPMYEQLMEQQRSAVGRGLAKGLLARVPGPNFVEVGCAFPNMPNAVLLAPSLGQREVVFDEEARQDLATKFRIRVQRHPRVEGYWQIVGCPT